MDFLDNAYFDNDISIRELQTSTGFDFLVYGSDQKFKKRTLGTIITKNIENFLEDKGELSTEDLNSIIIQGIYHQTHNIQATLVNNYPIDCAGTLEVRFGIDSEIFQQYTILSGQTEEDTIYTRGNFGGVWSVWKKSWNSGNFNPNSKADTTWVTQNFVPFVGANQSLQLANNDLSFVHDGAIRKTENQVAVFDDVYQGYYDSGTNQGALVIKFPRLSDHHTMITLDISIYGYSSNYLGKLTVAFYIYAGGIYTVTGHRAIFETTDNFPTTQVRVGVDGNNNVCICLGDGNTKWEGHFHFRVDKLSTTHFGYNADWNKGWSHNFDDGNFNGYVDLITPVTDVVATRSNINTTLNNYWKKWDNGTSKGFQSDSPFYFLDNSVQAQRIATSGIVVSNNYVDIVNVPSQGIFSVGLISTANDGNSTQWNAGYLRSIVSTSYEHSINGDTLNLNTSEGVQHKSTRNGFKVLDTRYATILENPDNNSYYFPNGNHASLDNKVSSIFHISPLYDGGNWATSLVIKGWTDDYKAARFTVPAGANDTEQDFFINQTKHSDGSWIADRKIWTDKHFSDTDVLNWKALQLASGNFVTVNDEQWINGTKKFSNTSNVIFYGNEENQVDVWKTSAGIDTIVSGHVYHFYSTSWKVGNKRSGGAGSLGYSFQFSSNGSATYDEKVLIQADGNILTSNFGAASDWNAKVSQSQLANYLPLSGGTLTSGGIIDARGNITLQQYEVGGSATGMFWQSIDDTQNISGIGVLTANGDFEYTYMGWGAYPWNPYTSLTISSNIFKYKNQDVWHSGNFNPAGKVNAYEKATSLGFSSSNSNAAPYIIHLDDGYVFLVSENATQYISGQKYFKKPLFVNSPDSVRGDLGSAGTNYKAQFSNGSSYGTAFWVESSGEGHIQQQRFDGTPTAYRLNLQPLGGELYYGNNEVATVNQLPNMGNYVTIDTPQTIIGNKNFAQTSDVKFLGNEYNDVSVWRNSVNAGFGGVVSGHILNWYSTAWKVGHQRGDSSESGGYGFWFSNGVNAFERRVQILTNGVIETSGTGDSLQWKAGYDFSLIGVTTNTVQTIDAHKTFRKGLSVRGSSVNTNETKIFLRNEAATIGWAISGGQNNMTEEHFMIGTWDETTFVRKLTLDNDGTLSIVGHGNSDNWYAAYLWTVNTGATQTWVNANFIKALENATGIGFSNGNASNAPYVVHSTNGLIYLATETWVNNQGFALNTSLNSYLPRTGGTMTGMLYFDDGVPGIQGTMADNDFWRVGGGNNGSNNGYLELATGDDGTEPIYVSQYGGVFSSLIRRATLLDSVGNTIFPESVYSNAFVKNGSNGDHFLLGDGGHLSRYNFDSNFRNSYRNFVNGTLIQTSIDYSQSGGDAWILEIKGNTYGRQMPINMTVQGYIYGDTIINLGSFSTVSMEGLVAMNLNGKLCFWFPRMGYWEGYSIKCYDVMGGVSSSLNRVTSIDNADDPGGTKRVAFTVKVLATNDNTWNKYIVSGFTGINATTPFSVLNGTTLQQVLTGGLLASDDYNDVSKIPYLGIHSKGLIQSEDGFQNRTYKVNQRNKIWNFGDSSTYGLSYYHGSYHALGEGIAFHFGDATDYKFYIKDNGNVFAKGTVFAPSFSSLALPGSQIINTNSTEIYLGNPSVDVIIETKNSELFHNRAGYGVGVVWTSHNHNPFKNLRNVPNVNDVSESGIYRQEQPPSGFSYTTTLNLNSGDGRQQLTIERSGGGMKFRGTNYGSGDQGWSPWKTVWDDNNFNPDTKVNKSGDTMTGNLNFANGAGIFSSVLAGNQMMNPTANNLYIGNIQLPYMTFESVGDLHHYRNGLGYAVIWDKHNLPDYRDYGLGTTLPNAGNIDDQRETGIYYVGFGSTGNKPWDFASVFHTKYTTNEYAQLAISHGQDGLAFRTDTYDWKTVYHSGNFNPDNKANALDSATGLGFVGGAPATPYVKHSNGTEVTVATATWCSNNFLTIHSNQNVTGIKTFLFSPVIPNASLPVHPVNLGQLSGILSSGYVKVDGNGRALAKGFIHTDYNDPNKILTSDGGVKHIYDLPGALKASGILSGNIDVPDEVMNLDLLINGNANLRLHSASPNQQGSKIVMKNLNTSGNFYIQINGVTLTNMPGNTRWEVVCYGTFWLVTTANGISFQI